MKPGIINAYDIKQKRQDAYKNESDPLFMAAQFDGTPESFNVWKDKVTEIKARYPLPENA